MQLFCLKSILILNELAKSFNLFLSILPIVFILDKFLIQSKNLINIQVYLIIKLLLTIKR